ncbi:MAG: hypothetical protein HRT35_32645 [Algicola sp.]|nr:hypothetical protein [Algicola sp.]
MKNINLKKTLAFMAVGLGLGMSSVTMAYDGNDSNDGTCQLFKDRCDAGMIIMCQRYYNQCT